MKKSFRTLLTVLLVMLITAGTLFAQGSKEDAKAAIPTITWYAVGNGMPDNYDSWKADVDAYLEEKLGCHLDYICVPWGDWDNRRNVVVTTNEPWDIMFGNDGTFFKDVTLGAYAPLNEMLKQTPGLTDLIPEGYWNATTVGGNIYAVPTYKDSSMTYYWVWTKDIVEKYGIPYEDLHRLADIRPWAEKVHKGEGTPVYYLAQDAPEYMGYDSFGTGCAPIGVAYNDETRTVVRAMEQPDFMAYLNELRTWYLEGLINSDAGTLQQVPSYSHLGAAWGWPAAAKGWGDGRGCEVVVSQWNDTILSAQTVLGSINSVNASSPNQLLALKVLERANTDTKFRDMLKYGEEGYNFTYNADGTVKPNPDKAWTFANYTQATFFVASIAEGEDPLQNQQIQALNDGAYPSVMLGFSFDQTAVENELINCKNIYKKYKQLLCTGSVDPNTAVPQMYAELDKAGLQKIMDEAQRQIDAAF